MYGNIYIFICGINTQDNLAEVKLVVLLWNFPNEVALYGAYARTEVQVK